MKRFQLNEIMSLTVRQPYATLLVLGLKRFETRGWSTRYRGPLIIHAAKKCSPSDVLRVQDLCRGIRVLPPMTEYQQRLAINRAWEETLGCAIGFVELGNCSLVSDGGSEFENAVGTFGPDRYGWECTFSDAFPEPIQDFGKLGLWKPSQRVIDCFANLRGMA